MITALGPWELEWTT